jgi:hypothetical protein
LLAGLKRRFVVQFGSISVSAELPEQDGSLLSLHRSEIREYPTHADAGR